MIIVIRGPLGVGKTTVAKKLAARLRGTYISVDAILAGRKLDAVVRGRIPLAHFLAANSIIAKRIRSAKPLVVDGNFYYSAQIRDIMKKIPMHAFVFTLVAPLRTCIDRDQTRKHPYGTKTTKAVYDLVTRFDAGIVIDARTKTPVQIANEIHRHLHKHRSAQ